MIGFLDAASQQRPEGLEVGVSYLRIPITQAHSSLKVYKGEVSELDLQTQSSSILGAVETSQSHITFKPLVPFDVETPYTLAYNNQYSIFEIERPEAYIPLQVVEVYPSVNEVPSNILKWYIQFSKAVNPIKVYEHIQFLDQDGKVIDRSILNLGAPLISPDGTLLTIWVEPGRQKQLLGPHHHLGRVFEPYKNYTLQIAASLKDSQGLQIESSIKHTFTATEADTITPSLSKWEALPLQVATRKPLTIISNDQLDYGSLLDAFSLLYEGEQVNGTLTYDSEKQTIFFTPINIWAEGLYTVNIEPLLEDLAGNNLRHLFDRPLGRTLNEEELKTTLVVKCH